MKTLTCPTCKKSVPLRGESAPFCSERCRLIDLGAWANEEHVISTPVQPSQGSDDDDH